MRRAWRVVNDWLELSAAAAVDRWAERICRPTQARTAGATEPPLYSHREGYCVERQGSPIALPRRRGGLRAERTPVPVQVEAVYMRTMHPAIVEAVTRDPGHEYNVVEYTG